MSSQIMERLRNEALELSEAERAELAHDLVRSLDGTADASAAGAWDAEILRRLQEIEAGAAKTVDREEFSRRIRERLNRL
jgi:putative addiction module component (TIGR02574 family)